MNLIGYTVILDLRGRMPKSGDWLVDAEESQAYGETSAELLH